MEQQSKKFFEKALEIYHTETNTIISSPSTKDLATLKKTQQRLETELAKFLQKELRSYGKLEDLTAKFMVCFHRYMAGTRDNKKLGTNKRRV